mmetsp:Transcript_2366/g.3505  ORF Transcript_2366/g.3505 Transcript_2366/m.3505 type:complete len:92 (+) Transcript_2366:273-548(+)
MGIFPISGGIAISISNSASICEYSRRGKEETSSIGNNIEIDWWYCVHILFDMLIMNMNCFFKRILKGWELFAATLSICEVNVEVCCTSQTK